jgi:hypothetical protein
MMGRSAAFADIAQAPWVPLTPLYVVPAAWRLMGAEMYDGMSNLQAPSPAIERGIALHKMIRAVSSCPFSG